MISQVGLRSRVDFENADLKTKKVKGKQKLYYKLNMFKQKCSFNILKNICQLVTLVRLMDSLGNANNAIGIVGYWIFDSNY